VAIAVVLLVATAAVAAPPPPPPPPSPPPPKEPPIACLVPRLAGKQVTLAWTLVRRAGCVAGRTRRVYSARVRRGRVISQRPGGGSRVPKGTAVHVTVSRGKAPATAPR
jgi:serine/threonine-protein kinase